MDNNNMNMNEGLSKEERQVVAVIGVINGCIQHPSTPDEVKQGLSGSLAAVLMDREEQFGFKGTQIQDEMLMQLAKTLDKLIHREKGSDILKGINLN